MLQIKYMIPKQRLGREPIKMIFKHRSERVRLKGKCLGQKEQDQAGSNESTPSVFKGWRRGMLGQGWGVKVKDGGRRGQ